MRQCDACQAAVMITMAVTTPRGSRYGTPGVSHLCIPCWRPAPIAVRPEVQRQSAKGKRAAGRQGSH